MSSLNFSFTSSKFEKENEASVFADAVEYIKELRDRCGNNVPMLIGIVTAGLKQVCCDWSNPPSLRDSFLLHSEQGRVLNETALGVVSYKKIEERTKLRRTRISAGMYYRVLPPCGSARRKTTSMFSKLVNALNEEYMPSTDADFTAIMHSNTYELMALFGESKGSFENSGLSYTANHIDWLCATPDAILKTFSNWYPIEVVKKTSAAEKLAKEKQKERRELRQASIAASFIERRSSNTPDTRNKKKRIQAQREESQQRHFEKLRQEAKSADQNPNLAKRKAKKTKEDEEFVPNPTKTKKTQQGARFKPLPEGDAPRSFGGKIVSESSFPKEIIQPRQKITIVLEDFVAHPEKVWQVKVAMVLFSSPKGMLLQLEENVARAKIITLTSSDIKHICSRQYSNHIFEAMDRIIEKKSTPEQEDQIFQKLSDKMAMQPGVYE